MNFQLVGESLREIKLPTGPTVNTISLNEAGSTYILGSLGFTEPFRI